MGGVAQALREMTIAYYIASPTWGGGEQYVYDLARQMKKDYQANVIFLFPNGSDKNMISRFQELGACPTFVFSGKWWRFSPMAGRKLAKILEQYHVDILHLNSRRSYFLGAWAKYFTKEKMQLVVTQHLVRKAKNTYFWRLAYRQIDALICVSEVVRRAYLQAWDTQSIPFRKSHVIHNSSPIDMPVAIPSAEPDVPTIFYHGRVCVEKGIFHLIHVLEGIANIPFRLVIAGAVATSDKQRWEQVQNSSPIRDRIEFLGFRTDISKLIPQYQIGVIPTLVPEAGGPIALLENMALGLPTICSDNGSQVEFIQDGSNGMLCAPSDTQSWTDAIKRLLTDKELRKKLAYQAQKDFYDKHTYAQFMERMTTIYGIK